MMQAEDTSQNDEPPSTINRGSSYCNDVKQAVGQSKRAYETKRRIGNEETVAEYRQLVDKLKELLNRKNGIKN